MNIFFLAQNPYKAAEMHCDKHVVKMIVESAQMLSVAHHHWNSKFKNYVYKGAYLNHPCTKWVCENGSNYRWLYQLFLGLIDEYHKRYNNRTHKCEKLLPFLRYNPHFVNYIEDPINVWKFKQLSNIPQAMPEKYKHKNPITAYRKYYIGEKALFAKWKNNNMPGWFLKGVVVKVVREFFLKKENKHLASTMGRSIKDAKKMMKL